MSKSKHRKFDNCWQILYEKGGKAFGHHDYKSFWNEFIYHFVSTPIWIYRWRREKDWIYPISKYQKGKITLREVAERVFEYSGKQLAYRNTKNYAEDMRAYIVDLINMEYTLEI